MNFKIKIAICFGLILVSIMSYEMSLDEIKKMPINYIMLSEQEGQDQILKDIGGSLSEPFWIRETLRDEVVDVKGNTLQIKSHVVGVDSASNKIVFDNTQTFFVDRNTRQHIDSGEYFTFPPNVEKKDYKFLYPMMFTSMIFVFNDVRTVNTLEVYDFSCSYAGLDVTSGFPQFQSKKILSDGGCKISVEPTTGIIISFSKNWDDYFVNNGIRESQVELGGKHTTEYSQAILIEQAKSTKSLYYFLDVILPSLILVIGGIATLLVTLFEKTKNQAKIILKTQNELLKKERLSAIGEITARISHDLRNPLSLIKMATEGIQMRIERKLDPKLDEYLPMISDAVFRLTHQINQVLGYVKTMPLDIRLTSISGILSDSIKYTRIPKNISIKLPENDQTIMADKIQLAIAFSNILSNAVEAIGENDGTIIVRAKTENDNLVMEFEDSGIGIPKENMDKMFSPLFTTKPNGTGLGLASVKDIVKAHGGTVTVSSPPTIFTIILPQSNVKNLLEKK